MRLIPNNVMLRGEVTVKLADKNKQGSKLKIRLFCIFVIVATIFVFLSIELNILKNQDKAPGEVALLH